MQQQPQLKARIGDTEMKSCLVAKCKHRFILEFLETVSITVNNNRDMVNLWMVMITLTE